MIRVEERCIDSYDPTDSGSLRLKTEKLIGLLLNFKIKALWIILIS